MLSWQYRRSPVAERKDYRESHIDRATDYDENLTGPLDAYMDKWEGHYLANLIGDLFKTKIPRYLDFACGTGRITRRVESFAMESYGVDISESMLSVARGKCLNTNFLCADLTRTDVDLGQFDVVTAFRFFGNAQDELRESALAAIQKRLHPGGYLILNNHRNPLSFLLEGQRFLHGHNPADLSYFKLKRLLRQNGFQLIRSYAIGFWIYRFKLTKTRFLTSKSAERLERAFQYSWFVPFSLNAVLVARKASE